VKKRSPKDYCIQDSRIISFQSVVTVIASSSNRHRSRSRQREFRALYLLLYTKLIFPPTKHTCMLIPARNLLNIVFFFNWTTLQQMMIKYELELDFSAFYSSVISNKRLFFVRNYAWISVYTVYSTWFISAFSFQKSGDAILVIHFSFLSAVASHRRFLLQPI
jgi:hypothetical protein